MVVFTLPRACMLHRPQLGLEPMQRRTGARSGAHPQVWSGVAATWSTRFAPSALMSVRVRCSRPGPTHPVLLLHAMQAAGGLQPGERPATIFGATHVASPTSSLQHGQCPQAASWRLPTRRTEPLGVMLVQDVHPPGLC
jgi:hypothetical protein